MRSWWRLALVPVVLLVACGDDDVASSPAETTSAADEAAPAGEPATAFEWVTTLDQDGFGYVLTVEGVVGDDHASYEMQVEPRYGPDGGDHDDLLAEIAGAAVNGLVDDGSGLGRASDIDPGGRTEVRVLGDERWYRSPWLLDEAAFAMGDAEWVRVPAGEAVIVDVVTAVLNERYDDALRRLVAAAEAGEALEAPAPEAGSSELDEILTPWIGLAGPAYPIGGPGTIAGDADEGEASWRQVLTYEPDGADGELSGVVRWRPTTAEAPEAPAAAVDVADLTAGLAG